MLKNVTDLPSVDYSKGLNTISNILAIKKNQTPNCMNVTINFDGSVEKRLGSTTQNSVVILNSAGAGFSPNAGALTASLRAFWKMDETNGSRLDAIGGHILLDNNTVADTAGKIKNAALFVATNTEYLLHANTSTLATGDVDFSMSTWFNLSRTDTLFQQTLIAKNNGILAYGVDSNTVLMLHMNGTNGGTNFVDSSSSAHIVVAAGSSRLSTVQSKFGGAAGAFLNNGDVLQIPSSTDFDFGVGDFTIDSWFWAITGGTTYGSLYDRGSRQFNIMPQLDVNGGLQIYIEDISKIDSNTQPKWLGNEWQHWALVRSSGILRFFHNGSSYFGDIVSTENVSNGSSLIIGSSSIAGIWQLPGYLDEFRVVKGVAIWKTSANFALPARSYYSATTSSEYEYWLYVDTDNKVTFNLSANGSSSSVEVKADSFGAVTTGTWYNAVAWHDTGNFAGVSVNLSINTASFAGGPRAGSSPFVIGAVSNGADMLLTGAIDESGFWKKVLTAQERSDLYNSGSGNTYAFAFDQTPWGSFDFGAQSTRWITMAAGTGVYASSDLGVNWVTIATDRSATFSYFERSKNVLIETTNAYDRPLAWPGSAGTFMVALNSNAPLAKFAVNFQGFCILMNTSTRKRSFFYQDENTQLTGTWANSFDLPSSADDEITGAFILRRYLYVSTKYKIFRVSYVGGNPDWSYSETKSWGYVPRTMKKLTMGEVGEVIIGEDWARRHRIFDGADDKIASSDVEDFNGMCDFATSKVSYSGSGLLTHFAEVDPNSNVYKLAVGIGDNTANVTHFINFDGRTASYYPYSNMNFGTMTVSESANQQFLMAFDRSGYCHLMDSGNLDSGKTPIDDTFDSPIVFDRSPSYISKSHKFDLFFSATSSGTLYYYDRTDFSSMFKERYRFVLSDTTNSVLIKQGIDVPTSYHAYQFRLSTSSGQAQPYRLVRNDNFLQGLGIGN